MSSFTNHILSWYNKDKNLPGRKMGHITKLLNFSDPNERREEAFLILNRIRSIWPIS